MKNFLVCVTEHEWHTRDSTQENCAECNCILWVSKSGMKAALDHDCEFLCAECAARQEAAVVFPPTPEQIMAVEGQLRRN